MRRPLRRGLATRLAHVPIVLASLLATACGGAPALDPAATPETGAIATPEPRPVATPDPRPVGREAIEALRFAPLVFEPPQVSEYEVLGVPVYHLYDPVYPLVDIFVQMRGGSGNFTREQLGPVSGFTSFIRNGGTLDLAPDSVERRADLLAIQLGFGGGGGSRFADLNSLRATIDDGLELLRDMLLRPGFDAEAVEIWRGQELERIRRREDDPTGLAYEEFNRLMFGDHPVGWVMDESDLAAERFTRDRLEHLHSLLHCRDRLILGVAGDLTWAEAEPKIRAFIEPWPECPEPLTPSPVPDLRVEGGVYILPRDVEQTTIVLAQPGGVRQEDTPDFFASRVANLILGGGGFTSRLMSRLRTERGLTYGVSSLWTTPLRWEGLVGAVTSTQGERTLEALELLVEAFEEFSTTPPDPDEVQRAVDQISNGYVFAFQSPRQIVSRYIGNRAQGLPGNWLERYLEGIQAVGPEDVFRVTSNHIDPAGMTVLLVGDPDRFGPGLEAYGPLYRLSTDGTVEPWTGPIPGSPGG